MKTPAGRRTITTLALIVLAALTFSISGAPGSAVAGGVRDCGSGGSLYDGQLRITNVTSRRVSCARAKRFARSFELRSGPESGFQCSEDFYCTWRGWQCRNDGRRRGVIDHRCENVDRVVRWQAR